jgi:multiple antibiotic resistance protein
MELLDEIVKAVAIVVLTLLPIINPIGNAPIFVSLARGHATTMRRMAIRVAVNSWIILMVSMLVGTYVLEMFGISLAIVRMGGGMLVAMAGWRMLYSEDDSAVRDAVVDQATEFSELEVAKRSFFPMSFPLTAGPGAIAAAITLGTAAPYAPANYLIGAVIAFLGTAATILIVYPCYRFATALLNKLGAIGTIVVMRLVAFILVCIGLQMMWTGWAELNGLPH